jgi:hypothetical protein
MTLHPPDGLAHVQGKQSARDQNPNKDNILVYFTEEAISLSQFFENNMADLNTISEKYGGLEIKWACCRSVKSHSCRRLSLLMGIAVVAHRTGEGLTIVTRTNNDSREDVVSSPDLHANGF